jgi:hypothetical protein
MDGRRTIAAAAAVLAIAFTGAASAQQAGAPGEAGLARNLYAGLAFGQSSAKEACSGLASCDKSDNAFGAFVGYWLHPGFAVEGGYHNLGKASAPGGTYVRSNVWELLGLGAWQPHGRAVSLYAKFGLARGAQEGGGALAAPKELSNGVTFGFGVQVDLAQRFGVRAEWQRYPRLGGGPVLPTGDIDVLRLAGLWRFR